MYSLLNQLFQPSTSCVQEFPPLKLMLVGSEAAGSITVEYCERSVGTVFQLSNPDAIYSRDEEKERRWLPPLVVRVCARPMRCWAKVGYHCRSRVRDRKEGSD
jgi:hypothetical protein